MFVVNSTNRLMSLAVSSDSESSRTVYHSNFSFSGCIAIELSENNFESLFAGADNEQAVDDFDRPACLQIKKIPGQGSLL